MSLHNIYYAQYRMGVGYVLRFTLIAPLVFTCTAAALILGYMLAEANKVWKLAVVCWPSSSNDRPRSSARVSAT